MSLTIVRFSTLVSTLRNSFSRLKESCFIKVETLRLRLAMRMGKQVKESEKERRLLY
jgi:hypothetical protein